MTSGYGMVPGGWDTELAPSENRSPIRLPIINDELENDDMRTHQGIIADLVNSLLPWTFMSTGATAIVFKEDSVATLFISLGAAIQLSTHLHLNLTSRTRKQNELLYKLTAYSVFLVFWQVVLQNPSLTCLLCIPFIQYFVSVGSEVHYSYAHSRHLIKNPTIEHASIALADGERSPFVLPHTSQNHYFTGTQIAEGLVGIGLWGAGMGYQRNPPISELMRIGGYLIVGDATGALGRKFWRDFYEALNTKVREDASKGNQESLAVAVPLRNQIFILLNDSVDCFGPLLGAFVAAYALDDKWMLLTISGIFLGIQREAAQKRLENSERLDPYAAARRTLAQRVAWVTTGVMGVLVPGYVGYTAYKTNANGEVPAEDKAYTIGAAELITGSLVLSYASYKAVQIVWGRHVTAKIPLLKRGKILSTVRLFIAESRGWLAYTGAVCLHMTGQSNVDEELSKILNLVGYGAVSASIGLNLASLDDIYHTEFKTPRVDMLASFVYVRLMAQILLGLRKE